MTLNQIALSKAAAKLAADIESLLPADIEGWDTQATADLAAAKAAQTAKATPLEITNDAMALANAIASEIGNQKVASLVADLTSTASDVEAGKPMKVIADLVADYKAARAL